MKRLILIGFLTGCSTFGESVVSDSDFESKKVSHDDQVVIDRNVDSIDTTYKKLREALAIECGQKAVSCLNKYASSQDLQNACLTKIDIKRGMCESILKEYAAFDYSCFKSGSKMGLEIWSNNLKVSICSIQTASQLESIKKCRNLFADISIECPLYKGDMKAAAAFPNLKKLTLSSKILPPKELSALVDARSLDELVISMGLKTEKQFNELRKLSQVRKMNLTFSVDSDLPEVLEEIDFLEELILDSNFRAKDIASLSGSKKLKKLSLKNGDSSILESIGALSKSPVEEIYLWGMDPSKQGFKELSKLKSLRRLSIVGPDNILDFDGVPGLAALEYLEIFAKKIEITNLVSFLKRCPNLDRVKIAGKEVANAMAEIATDVGTATNGTVYKINRKNRVDD